MDTYRLNAQLQEVQRPFMTAGQPQPPQFGFHSNVLPTATAYNHSAGLQLVPYQQQQQQQNENVRQPLTPEQLNKLYSMSYAVQPYHRSNSINSTAAAGPGIMYRQTIPVIAQQPAIFAQSAAHVQMPMQHQNINAMPNPFSQQPIFMPTHAGTVKQSINVPMPMSQINNVSNIGSTVSQLPPKQYSPLPSLSVTTDQPSTSSGITALNRFQVNKDVIRRQKKPTGDLIDLGNRIDDK